QDGDSMGRNTGIWFVLAVVSLGLAGVSAWQVTCLSADPPTPRDSLEQRFAKQVQPFLKRYCFSCHGPKKQEAALDLSRDTTMTAVVKNERQWGHVLERLQSQEMPPEGAPRLPEREERAAVVAWIRDLHDDQADRNAGDPGPVLARRLSNAE